jgi:hypothetical protein
MMPSVGSTTVVYLPENCCNILRALTGVSLHTSTRGTVTLPNAVGVCERGVRRTWEVGLKVAIP